MLIDKLFKEEISRLNMKKGWFIVGVILIGIGILLSFLPDPYSSYNIPFFIFGIVIAVLGIVMANKKLSFKPISQWKK